MLSNPEGLHSLAEHEANAIWFMSGKEDFSKDDEFKSSKVFEKLQMAHQASPSSHHLAVAIYAVMVGDLIVNPKQDPIELYADVQAFRNYATTALKIAKKDVPVEITAKFDKLVKDIGS